MHDPSLTRFSPGRHQLGVTDADIYLPDPLSNPTGAPKYYGVAPCETIRPNAPGRTLSHTFAQLTRTLEEWITRVIPYQVPSPGAHEALVQAQPRESLLVEVCFRLLQHR
jgi:hypothetical protein